MVKIYKITLLLFVFTLFPAFAKAANLSITPSEATFEVGDSVTLQVVVSTNSNINAVSSSISFPVDLFSIESVSKAGSILNFWVVEPSFSKSAGTVSLEGVSLGGFLGTTGNVLTIRARALKVGAGSISFKSGQILANDGQGTDITQGLIGSKITIVEPKVKIKPAEPKIQVIEEVKEIPEEPKISNVLKAPEISYGYKYGDRAIVGLSDYPREQVLLTFISQTCSKIFISGVADVNGDFIILVPNILKKGIYTVSAVMVKGDGKNSEQSNTITIDVGNFFSDIGWETFSLLGLLLLIIIYQVWRMSQSSSNHLSKKTKREVDDAKNVVHKSFDILRYDLKSKKASVLKKDIDDAEYLISKNIKDIENL